MNEEEKKAIEFIKDLIAWDVRQDLCPNKEECENLEIILNLIEKLQKENKELKTITNQYETYECEAPKNSKAKIIIADKFYFNNGYFKNNFIEIDKIKRVFEDFEKLMKAGEENVGSNVFNGRNHS